MSIVVYCSIPLKGAFLAPLAFLAPSYNGTYQLCCCLNYVDFPIVYIA